MTKDMFLQELKDALSPLAAAERDDVLRFYEEVISDRIAQDPSREEETIAALGDVKDTAAAILREMAQTAAGRAAALEAENTTDSHGDIPNPFKEITLPVNSVKELMIDSFETPLVIQTHERDTVIILYQEDENHMYDLFRDGAAVRFVRRPQPQSLISLMRFFRSEKSSPITLFLPADSPVTLEAKTRNANIRCENLRFWGDLTLSTRNAAIAATGLSGRSITITTSNGVITAERLKTDKALELATSNAKISVRDLRCGLSLTTKTTNGAIACAGLVAKDIALSTSNAKISGVLPGPESLYRISATTSNASNNLLHGSQSGDIPLSVRTSNGKISVDFDEAITGEP